MAPPQEATPRARAATLEAIARDDSVAEAHYALALLKMASDWDWAGAEREFVRAIEINPSFPDARAYFSHLLMITRRPAEALAQIERAMELDPYSPLFRSLYAIDLLWVRRYDEAIAQGREALRTSNDPVAHSVLWIALERKGKHKEALPEAREYLDGQYNDRDVRAALERGSRFHQSFALPCDVSMLYASREQTLAWLEKGLEVHDPTLPYLETPLWDLVRNDPRADAVARRVGLPRR